MKKNSYSRYVLSDLYKEKLMHAAITAAKKSAKIANAAAFFIL